MMGFGMLSGYGYGAELGGLSRGKSGDGKVDSQDPLGFAAGDADLYGYAENTPTDLVDRSGDDPYGGITTS